MIKQANEAIRAMLNEHGLKHYWVAEELGITQYTFCHWLQVELPPRKKEAVLKAIIRVIDKANTTTTERKHYYEG